MIDKDKEIFYYHNDSVGLPQEITDASNNVVWSARYDALGNIEEQYAEEIENPLRFQGQYFDPEIDLSYNRHRYFDPKTCSFISQDPLGLAAGENLYSYAPNVWGWFDPMGLCKKDASSSGFGKYSTSIDDSVSVVKKDNSLPDWLKETYTDGNYRTVVNDKDVSLYRVFGGNADAGGAFTTTSPALNRIQAKLDSALLPGWKGTRMYEAEIVVPKGNILNIGKVAPQTIKSSGTVLPGGADQVLMPSNWPLKWIEKIRVVEP